MTHFIDTHCHLDLYPTPVELAKQAESAGIYTIAMTNSPAVFDHTLRVTVGLKFVRPSVGLHPQLAAERSGETEMVCRFLTRTRYVGEIGLDYSDASESVRKVQRQVFAEILQKSAEFGDKVLSIHSRCAAADVISMVGPCYPGTIIFHWFSGSATDLGKAISIGAFFSVNHQMLKGRKGRDLVLAMPPDKVLTESDGPFTKVGGDVAGPATILHVVDGLALLWHIDPEEARDRIFTNFRLTLQPKTHDELDHKRT